MMRHGTEMDGTVRHLEDRGIPCYLELVEKGRVRQSHREPIHRFDLPGADVHLQSDLEMNITSME